MSQKSLETYDNVSEGKKITHNQTHTHTHIHSLSLSHTHTHTQTHRKVHEGLGQTSMSVAEPCEDIVSMILTATRDLWRKQMWILRGGRLEVGTETLVDKSKSTKTSLMRLFGDANGDIEGVDTINACYGGTNALFFLHWMSSPSWDGRYAIIAETLRCARVVLRPGRSWCDRYVARKGRSDSILPIRATHGGRVRFLQTDRS